MTGIVKRIKKSLRDAFPGLNRGKQLKNLEERSTRPTASEKVVVRPSKKVKKRKVLSTD